MARVLGNKKLIIKNYELVVIYDTYAILYNLKYIYDLRKYGNAKYMINCPIINTTINIAINANNR